MRRIEVDSESLLRGSWITASDHLDKAIASIDARFGRDYAKQHPELVAAFMQAAAIDLGTAIIAGAIEDVSETIGAAIEALGPE